MVDPDRAGERVGRIIGSTSRRLAGTIPAHLHADAPAHALVRRMGVPAFTVGTHVFAAPEAPGGVLRHELAHVLQSRRRPDVRAALEPGRRRAAEREARDHEHRPTEDAGEIREGGFVHFYGEAGHFYTVYLVALAVGFDARTAFEIAFYAQMPDEVEELDATAVAFEAVLEGLQPPAVEVCEDVQRGGHSLTGRPSAEEQARRIDVVTGGDPASPEFGLAVHALGDAFAHSTMGNPAMMYQAPWGHASQLSGMHDPDSISVRPMLYVRYFHALYDAFAAAAAGHLQLVDPSRALDEGAVASMAWIIAGTPEGQQISTIRGLSQAAGYTMDPYAPELVEGQPFAEFQKDPAPGQTSPAATGAATAVTLEQSREFMAGQEAQLPAGLVDDGAANLAGLFFDIAQAGIGAGVQAFNEQVLQLQVEFGQFLESPYGAGF